MKTHNDMLLAILLSAGSLLGGCSKKSSGGSPNVTPFITISDVNQVEGNVAGTMPFTVTLDKATSLTVTVQYNTLDGSAKSGEDYTASSGTLTFAPQETSKTINIPIVGDDGREGNESFTVILSNSTNANFTRQTATGTIENDDTRVAFDNTGYDAPTSYPGYTLAWADEFNNTTLNTSDWSFENGDGCPGNCGWGNNELEWYQPNNLFFQDGKMIIEARPENAGTKNYTSSKILTRGKKFFKYGRIDFRAKLTKGKGIWPAFWMMPQDNVYGGWPKSGEIDIMENIGHEPNRTYGTIHFGPGPGSTQLGRNYTLPSGNFNDQFHVFSLEWRQNSLKWLVDGVVYSTWTNADFGTNNYPFNENFYMIINLAVGGNWPGNPDATTTFPQWLIVDYVRVYQ